MSRLFEASRSFGLNPLAELMRGFVPRLSLPLLPAWIAIGGITCGSVLATMPAAKAANGRVVQSTTIPTGSGCTNCGQNRSVVTHSQIPGQVVSVGNAWQPSQPVQHGQVVHQGSSVVGGTQVFHGNPSVPTSRVSHGGQVIHQTSKPSVVPVSHSVASSQRGGGAVSNVLSTLNAQRSRQGLRGLAYDPQLQAVAERRAQLMASTGLKTHPSGSFAPGRYEGVGWSSSHTPAGVSACYTSDPNMRVAGAAMARGRDGVYFCVVYR